MNNNNKKKCYGETSFTHSERHQSVIESTRCRWQDVFLDTIVSVGNGIFWKSSWQCEATLFPWQSKQLNFSPWTFCSCFEILVKGWLSVDLLLPPFTEYFPLSLSSHFYQIVITPFVSRCRSGHRIKRFKIWFFLSCHICLPEGLEPNLFITKKKL